MRRTLLALLAALLALAAAPAAAQGLPLSLGFEGAADDAPIGAYGGLRFGPGWRFGDLASGRYNAPFPDLCPDFGGQCSYAISGAGFARVAGAPGGRIDLPGGAASLSLAASTADPLELRAYTAAGALVDADTVAPNLLTGRLDRAAVQAPAGVRIAYVIVSGGRDTWLIDDLETALLSPAAPARPARIALAQRSPDHAAPGAIVSLDLVAASYGPGPALAATIELPYDDALLTLVDAQLSRPAAWVSALEPGLVTIRTGPLGAGGDVVTATLRFRLRADAPAGAALGRLARLSYEDETTARGVGRSNLPATVVGAAPAAPAYRAPELAAAPAAVRYAAAVFAPGEPVGIWYHPPAGPPVALATVRADGDGRVGGELGLAGLAPGDYTLVLFSHHSQITLVGAFRL